MQRLSRVRSPVPPSDHVEQLLSTLTSSKSNSPSQATRKNSPSPPTMHLVSTKQERERQRKQQWRKELSRDLWRLSKEEIRNLSRGTR
mmetsp:Transcript_19274/g.35797  ORF Transcript_19274/g.35797 Transcript_19274/m.35797 type:complete len:88 (+) Transcript_19274:62-325(+)